MKADLTLDAGALIAYERGHDRARGVIDAALGQRKAVHVPPGVLAQVWRNGSRQVHLARLLARPGVTLLTFEPATARIVGEVLAASGRTDVVDGHVAVHARQHDHVVVTSDPDDLRAIDPTLTVIVV